MLNIFYKLKYLYKNFKFFWPHIVNMRAFDYSFQIDLFSDSLKYLAQGLKDYNHCVSSERNYKRCLTASQMLKKAYNFEFYNDKSYVNWASRIKYTFKELDSGYGQLVRTYIDSEEYAEKMHDIITKRLRKEEEELKKEAWIYIHKYIQHWWD